MNDTMAKRRRSDGSFVVMLRNRIARPAYEAQDPVLGMAFVAAAWGLAPWAILGITAGESHFKPVAWRDRDSDSLGIALMTAEVMDRALARAEPRSPEAQLLRRVPHGMNVLPSIAAAILAATIKVNNAAEGPESTLALAARDRKIAATKLAARMAAAVILGPSGAVDPVAILDAAREIVEQPGILPFEPRGEREWEQKLLVMTSPVEWHRLEFPYHWLRQYILEGTE